MFSMFLRLVRTLFPFIDLPQITMSFWNFIQIFFLLRIGQRGKLFFKADVSEGSTRCVLLPLLRQIRVPSPSTKYRRPVGIAGLVILPPW
jgi:hypothetical protein